MKFEDFLSNKTAVTVLKRAADDETLLRHAYLLHGSKGVGKRTLAGIFASALLCRGENKPCGECVPCMKLQKGIHPDVMVLEKPKGKNNIPVEAVRDDLRDFLYIKPNEAEHKIVLIPNAEEMSLNASNALLKMLEEPPSYVVFVLTADNISLLPSTIASRCVCLELLELSSHQAEKYLTANFPESLPGEIESAVLYGGGNLGRSIGFLKDEEVKERFKKASALLEALGKSEYSAAALLSEFERDREGLLLLLRDLDLLIGDSISGRETGRLSAVLAKGNILPSKGARLHEVILEAQLRLRMNGAVGLTAMWFCSEAAGSF